MNKLQNPWISRALPALVIAGAGACVLLPFLWLAIPSGHDFEFHLNSWIEVLDEWKAGVLYPHWAAMAHYGYGEARFIFYPPVSWTLGAILGAILPWKLVPAAFIWIVLSLTGWSMFRLTKNFLSRADAIFCAALYAVNPYHVIIVFWRSAWAELMISIYLPLLFLLILRMKEDRLRIVPPLGLLLGASWLTNVPGAVMMHYSLGLFLLCLALQARSLRPIMYGIIAVAAGAAVSAIYLVPVLHQQRWIHIEQLLSPGLSAPDNVLFARTTDAYHDRFNFLVSVIGTWEIAFTLLLFVLSRRLKAQRAWWLALAWAAFSTVLMFKPSLLLWAHFPELKYVQLPWRWLLCLGLPFALVTVMALRNWWSRTAVYALMLAIVMIGWHRLQTPWWDKAADIQEMVDNEHDGIGNEGIDEYVPVTADTDEADSKAPLARFEGKASADVQVKQWRPESRLVEVRASSPGKIILRLFNYPSWRVTVNDKLSPSETIEPSGQMAVPLSAGRNVVRVVFGEGWDRIMGGAISLFGFAALAIWWGIERKRSSLVVVRSSLAETSL